MAGGSASALSLSRPPNLPTLAGGPGEWATARTGGSAREPSSSTDRNEVVHVHALHDEKPARAVGLAVHVMRGLRRHRASLARQETIDVARCACLDHHRPLKTNEAVADLCMVMPRHALAGRKGQHLQCKRATAPITRSSAASWSPRAPICAWRIVLRLAYQNAIYHESRHSKSAGDVRNLHSRLERRANEICCSFRNLLNPRDLDIAGGRSLAS